MSEHWTEAESLRARVQYLEGVRDHLRRMLKEGATRIADLELKLSSREVGAKESAKYACGLDRDKRLLREAAKEALAEDDPKTLRRILSEALDATADQPDEEDARE